MKKWIDDLEQIVFIYHKTRYYQKKEKNTLDC
jgi:hypothetical protein